MPYHDYKTSFLNGLNIKEKIIILHPAWELDSEAWITEEGEVWGTNHGSFYKLTIEELEKHIEIAEKCIEGYKKAIKTLKENK